MVNRKRDAYRPFGDRMHALTPKAPEAVTVGGVVDNGPVRRPTRLEVALIRPLVRRRRDLDKAMKDALAVSALSSRTEGLIGIQHAQPPGCIDQRRDAAAGLSRSTFLPIIP